MTKTHYCMSCGSGTIYDGISRPRFCSSCSAPQSPFATAQAPPRQAPHQHRPQPAYDDEENTSQAGSYNIEDLISAIPVPKINKPISGKEACGQADASSDILGDFKRPKVSKKDFNAYEKRMKDNNKVTFNYD